MFRRSLFIAATWTTIACSPLRLWASVPLVQKIEHVVIVSSDPQQLFVTFTEILQLPVVWPFKDYGNFASGGISMGNVVIEFAKVSDMKMNGKSASVLGFALQPLGDADSAVAELDRLGISHSAPDRSHETDGWVTIELTRMPPAGSIIFFCDYMQRVRVNASRANAAETLRENGGGPLGVIRAKDVIIGAPSPAAAIDVWESLTEIRRGGKGFVQFAEGPGILFVTSKKSEIRGVDIVVKNVSQAKAFLKARHMLDGAKRGSVRIDPKSIDGLRLALMEQ